MVPARQVGPQDLIEFRCPFCSHETKVHPQFAGQSGPCASCGQTITIPQAKSTPQTARSPRPKAGPPAWVRGLLIASGCALVLGILAFVVLMVVLPSVRQARATARALSCQTQLERIAAAMHAYHRDHGHFPPAYSVDANGQPLHSWRVLLLPYLGPEAASIYQRIQLQEAWNGPFNGQLSIPVPAVYACPEDQPIRPQDTSYCVVTGPGFLFEGNQTKSISDIQDGLANTVMVVETSESGIHWMEPKDLTAQQWSLGINSGNPRTCHSLHEGSMAYVVYADAEVGSLSDVTPPEELRALATIAGGEQNAEPDEEHSHADDSSNP